MHRSRLGAITIDCNTGDLEGAATFRSGTLGCPMVHHIGPLGDLWQS